MILRPRIGSVVLLMLTALPVTALAQGRPEAGPPLPPPVDYAPPPSPFETGMRGFGMGLTAGIAGGYLFARQDGWTSRDWRPMVAGAGVGALAGGLLGFTLGMMDSNSTPSRPIMSPGRSYLVMRGMSEGGLFGMVTGGIVGGLVALKTDKPEHILLGAAIGTLSGTVLGLVFGSVQPNPWSMRRERVAWSVSVAPVANAHGGLAFGPGVLATF
jgi:hypothetical protein